MCPFFELDKKRPSHLLNVIMKSSNSKIWNILILSQTLWILLDKKTTTKKSEFDMKDNMTDKGTHMVIFCPSVCIWNKNIFEVTGLKE